MSDVAVDFLRDALTDIIRAVLTIDMLVDVNVNVFPRVMTAFGFAMPDPLEGFRC